MVPTHITGLAPMELDRVTHVDALIGASISNWLIIGTPSGIYGDIDGHEVTASSMKYPHYQFMLFELPEKKFFVLMHEDLNLTCGHPLGLQYELIVKKIRLAIGCISVRVSDRNIGIVQSFNDHLERPGERIS